MGPIKSSNVPWTYGVHRYIGVRSDAAGSWEAAGPHYLREIARNVAGRRETYSLGKRISCTTFMSCSGLINPGVRLKGSEGSLLHFKRGFVDLREQMQTWSLDLLRLEHLSPSKSSALAVLLVDLLRRSFSCNEWYDVVTANGLGNSPTRLECVRDPKGERAKGCLIYVTKPSSLGLYESSSSAGSCSQA